MKLIRLIAENICIRDAEEKLKKDISIDLEGSLYMYNNGLILKSNDKLYAIPTKNIDDIKRDEYRKGIELLMNNRSFLVTDHGSKETYIKLEALRHYLLPYLN